MAFSRIPILPKCFTFYVNIGCPDRNAHFPDDMTHVFARLARLLG
jgi:hypothetical protein